MQDQPKYSIILPVKNGISYIKECVNSILNQQYPYFNFHILDNCSTDGTSAWVKSLEDNRIIYIPAAKPLTVEENWARIASVSKNEFMTIIGHDDILLPGYLKGLNNLIQKNPTASLYQTHFDYIDSNGNTIRPCKKVPEKVEAPWFLLGFMTNTIDIMSTGYMMRSKDYENLGGIPYYPSLFFADLELLINLNNISFQAVLPDTLFYYRQHNSSTTKSAPDNKIQMAFRQFLQFLEELDQGNPLFHQVISENSIRFIRSNCLSLSHRLLRTPFEKRRPLTVEGFINDCKAEADILVPGNNFIPKNDRQLMLAKNIDSNSLTRELFLFFKKLYSKPLYS
jgi:glycosyltransferase involved in cell wall biosynthesis